LEKDNPSPFKNASLSNIKHGIVGTRNGKFNQSVVKDLSFCDEN
jgi:hypothetical protein